MLAALRPLLLALLLAPLIACQGAGPTRAANPDGATPAHVGGYALLDQLMAKQAQVGMLLMIKDETPQVGAIIKAIAQSCGEAHQQLKNFATIDPALKLDIDPLPAIDRRTRDLIEATSRGELLSQSGSEFELALLLTQVRSMQYGSHLARAIAEVDDNETRKAFLGKLSEELAGHQDAVTALLQRRASP